MSLVPSMASRDQIPGWFSSIFNKRVQFGLDLQGGLHIIYSIDLDKAVDDKATELKRDMEAQLEELKIGGRVYTPSTPVGAVSVILDDAKNLEQVKNRVARDYDEIVVMRDCPGQREQSQVGVLPGELGLRRRHQAIGSAAGHPNRA